MYHCAHESYTGGRDEDRKGKRERGWREKGVEKNTETIRRRRIKISICRRKTRKRERMRIEESDSSRW